MYDRSFLSDTTERAIATLIETTLALLATSTWTDWSSLSFWQSLAVGAVTAAASVVKSAIAARRRDAISPASFAKENP